MPSTVNIRDLLEAGAHYGHQCRRWDPRMQKYIFGARNGVHIIDLQKTVVALKEACKFLEVVAAKGGHVLFVGTKRQARESLVQEATRCKMYYVQNRWLGGTLTNFPTIRKSIHRLKKIEKMSQDGTYEKLTKKEALNLERTRQRLEDNIGGFKDMPGLPKALFVADAHKEHIAIKEAQKLGIPVVAITDTNANPEVIDYVIPGNDDSLKSLQLFIQSAADACLEGRQRQGEFAAEEEAAETKEGTIYDKEGHSIKVMRKKKEEEA